MELSEKQTNTYTYTSGPNINSNKFSKKTLIKSRITDQNAGTLEENQTKAYPKGL